MTTEAQADIRRKETADWFARLNQRRVTTSDVQAFSAWRRDPANARAFDRMQAMWEAAHALLLQGCRRCETRRGTRRPAAA